MFKAVTYKLCTQKEPPEGRCVGNVHAKIRTQLPIITSEDMLRVENKQQPFCYMRVNCLLTFALGEITSTVQSVRMYQIKLDRVKAGRVKDI